MMIDVTPPDLWEQLNDRVKAHWSLPERVRVRCYDGLSQAAFEVTQGTAQFLSHKRAIAAILGQTPIFEGLLPFYYKDTYQVQTIAAPELKDVKAWVDGLHRDTAFVMVAEDHPVTGELYSFVDELDRLLNAKRILTVRVSHARHFYDKIEILPYSVRLCSFAPDVTVALVGERFRSPSLSAHSQFWQKENFIAQLDQAAQGRRLAAESIAEFENKISSTAKLWFQKGTARLQDRSVFVLSDVSAEAVAQVLFKKRQITPEEGWLKINSTNLCHWQTQRMFQSWWLPLPSLETLRGLMIVSPDLLEAKDFAKNLISAYEEVRSLQSWSL